MIGGRRYRRWFYATGAPGWSRFQQGMPAYGRGFGGAGPNCDQFPWMPRGWWRASGPVGWSPEGPQLTEITKQQEIDALDAHRKAMETQLDSLKQALKEISEDITQLKKEVK